MDSITHIVIGATVGELLGGKRLGKRAMLIGAVAQSLPDVDFVAGLWMSPSRYFLAHRGFTHSFLFVGIVSLLLPFVVNNFSSIKMKYREWAVFFLVQLLTHILLDSLNAYGVGWFEPFSHMRISFDLLFVADPFLAIWPAIACLALLILGSQSVNRIKWALAGIVFSFIYIVYAMNNKATINKHVIQSFKTECISATYVLATPTPMNSWLWYVIAATPDGYFIGYHSVFDRNSSVPYQYFPKNDSLLDPVRTKKETQDLIRLARGLYTVQHHHDTVVFSNLRFGQINGWENARADFVFHYNLGKSGNSLLSVQQGRLSGWRRETADAFIKRINGN